MSAPEPGRAPETAGASQSSASLPRLPHDPGQSCLFLPMDRCSVGWTGRCVRLYMHKQRHVCIYAYIHAHPGVYFLRYALRVAVEPVCDNSHRVNNYLVRSLKDAGLWSPVLAAMVPFVSCLFPVLFVS